VSSDPIDYAAAFGAMCVDVDLARDAVERGDYNYAIGLLFWARSHAEEDGRRHYARTRVEAEA
jgi:hypothetical protein